MTAPLRILVPLDGTMLSEQPIPYAATLAGRTGTIVALRVLAMPEPIEDFAGAKHDLNDQDLERMKEAAIAETRKVFERWHGVVLQTETMVRFGNPAQKIVEAAEQAHCDLIMMASHTRGKVGRAILGSVTDEVSHMAEMPVMIVRPIDAIVEPGRAGLFRVVVPIDGTGLASTAIPHALRIAQHLDRQIHLVRVIPAIDKTLAFEALSPMPVHVHLDEAMARTENAGRPLEKIAGELGEAGMEVTYEVATGDAFDALKRTLRPGDLVVMRSRGQTGLRRLARGSLADRLVRDGIAPVMLVHNGLPRSVARPMAGLAAV